MNRRMFPLPSATVALALLLAAGCATPHRPAAPQAAAPAPATKPAGKRFAILMYERGDAWHNTPRAERDILMRKYALWTKSLEQQGIMKEGVAVGRGGAMITAGLSREPIAERLDPRAESLTGVFVIEVANAAEAERIAATCPALLHGESVHVRPVGHE
ncbi:MAG: YciI family protein [Planctomycetota bacterium]